MSYRIQSIPFPKISPQTHARSASFSVVSTSPPPPAAPPRRSTFVRHSPSKPRQIGIVTPFHATPGFSAKQVYARPTLQVRSVKFDASRMTTDIFSDIGYCLSCEKPLRDSNASYCDDVCKANDGYSRRLRTGIEDSPSIMASLPALLASNIKSNSRPRGQDASASTSSQSETSSPLQSPSPFAHPVLGLESSPKEDAFTLPPPAYPHPHPLYHNTFNVSSNPVKIPTYKTSSPNADLSHSQRESYKEQLSNTPTKGVESTLRYGRRPGHTNSVTSPLALLPFGSTKRHDSNGAVRSSNVLGSPAFAPLRNVSDSSVITQNGDTKRKSFAYGTHSPLLLAANAVRAPSAAVDFSNASANPRDQSPQLQASSSTAALRSAQNGNTERQSRSSSRPRIVLKETPVDNRRKSFPAQLFTGLRPKLTASATQMDARAHPVICSDSEEDLVPPPADSERNDSRRGRSRERKMSAVDREGSRSRSSRTPSSHLGLEGMTQQRTGRSGSRMRRERDGERDRKRSHGRRNRDRSQSSSDRERSSGDDQSSRNNHAAPRLTTRDSHYNPELDTIIGSLQNEQQAGQSVERGRGSKAGDIAYEGFRTGSPLATIKPSRKQSRPVGPTFSPQVSASELSDEPDRRSRSKSTSEYKRPFDARVFT